MEFYLIFYIIGIWIPAILANNYRLPDAIVPENYRLEIITHLGDNNNFTFTGDVWIKVR